MNKLKSLIGKGKELFHEIYYVEPPENVFRTYDVYDIYEKDAYFLWLNQTKAFLYKNFANHPFLREFIELSKKITPDNHKQMVSILEALQEEYNEEPAKEDQLQELDRLEREYVNVKDTEGAVSLYAIQHFHEWYEYAVKVFFKYVGENDVDFQRFKSMEPHGNVYVLSRVYNLLRPSYIVLREKAKRNSNNQPQVQLVMPESKKQKQENPNIFISYSHQDKKYLDKLLRHLKVFQKQNNQVDVWSDKQIKVGDKWKEEIEKALDRASIAFLLVSTDFLGSDFVTNNELPKLLQKSSEEGTVIVPIIVASCLFEDSNIGMFQAVNSPDKPLAEMKDNEIDKLFVDLLKQIKQRFLE